VLASDIGGMGELITNQHNGLLFERSNLNDLVEKIEYAYNNQDKMQAMSEVAYQNIISNYSLNKYISEYEQVFRN
ncbi:MAG: glycosyltransferase, partial [Bdellovibrionales bacterium]|nr:glycosyltransferase [Bdellovibrionales bacterium]